jgi:asparagine synthase (glutamine-hydrolysing)
MCGIAGFINLDGAPASRTTIAAMNAQQSHRGPDGEGIYIQGNVALGHTRLAILDPTDDGAQPMSYANGRYRITFNGEIYNFIELRRELISHGHRFFSETDTEVILAAYAEWGMDCQHRFNGMWGMAIWDEQERSLFLSRDRFGVKPAFYSLTDRVFAFASELKAFIGLNPDAVNFNSGAVTLALLNSYLAAADDSTILKDVRQLRPGHCLLMREGKDAVLTRWWKTLEHLPSACGREEGEARVREIFLDACAIRMRSDVPIATALSGGLDSSLVHGAVARLGRDGGNRSRQASDWRRAVHAYFPNSRQDERAYAEDAIRHESTSGLFVKLNAADALPHIDDAIYATESVSDNTTALWLTYRAMSRAGVKVSLDGHGADELFAGYHHYPQLAAEVAKDPGKKADFEEILGAMTVPSRSTSNLPFELDRAHFIAARPEIPDRTPLVNELRSAQGFDPVSLELYLDFHYKTLPSILRNFDRCSMAHGVEIRAPFLDWRMVVQAFAMPLSEKLGEGFSKLALRRALGDLLSPMVKARKSKLGFVTPIDEWMGEGIGAFVQETVSSRRFQQSHLWHGPMLAFALEKYMAYGDQRIIGWIWPMVQIARLMELFEQRAAGVRARQLNSPAAPV